MKIRIMSLLTILCIALSSAAFGQQFYPDNVVKRAYCLSGNNNGCATVPITLTLGENSWCCYLFKSHVINYPELSGKNYPGTYNKITVSMGSKSSTGTYYLPTTIGGTTIIPATELNFSTYGYGVAIKKTANEQFTLTVTRFERWTY